jgi:hypothetical protein
VLDPKAIEQNLLQDYNTVYMENHQLVALRSDTITSPNRIYASSTERVLAFTFTNPEKADCLLVTVYGKSGQGQDEHEDLWTEIWSALHEGGHAEKLTFIAGDFNFAECKEDRLHIQNGTVEPSGCTAIIENSRHSMIEDGRKSTTKYTPVDLHQASQQDWSAQEGKMWLLDHGYTHIQAAPNEMRVASRLDDILCFMPDPEHYRFSSKSSWHLDPRYDHATLTAEVQQRGSKTHRAKRPKGPKRVKFPATPEKYKTLLMKINERLSQVHLHEALTTQDAWDAAMPGIMRDAYRVLGTQGVPQPCPYERNLNKLETQIQRVVKEIEGYEPETAMEWLWQRALSPVDDETGTCLWRFP